MKPPSYDKCATFAACELKPEDNKQPPAYCFSDLEKKRMSQLTIAALIQIMSGQTFSFAKIQKHIAGNLRLTLQIPEEKATFAAAHCVKIIKEELHMTELECVDDEAGI